MRLINVLLAYLLTYLPEKAIDNAVKRPPQATAGMCVSQRLT